MKDVYVRMEREQVEVTRDGTLPPFKPDYQRVFIPGLTTYYVTVDGEELPPMSPEQYEAWRLAHKEETPAFWEPPADGIYRGYEVEATKGVDNFFGPVAHKEETP